MFDAIVEDLSQRYGLGERGRDLFALLVAYTHNDRRGGFPGFIEGFREQGHGELVSSWLGNPDAGGLNASDVGMVFGQGLLNDWGNRLGVSRATVAAAIAGVLPRLVAALTPGGRVPGGFGVPLPVAEHASSAASARMRSAPLPGGGDAVGAGAPDAAFVSAPHRDAPTLHDARDEARMAPVSAHDGYGRRFDADRSAPPQPSEALRREPAAVPAAARAPVEARPALDPAEQRALDMAAMFDRPARGERGGLAGPGNVRPDHWRAAVHPPRRKRGFGGLSWLVVLLVLLAGAGWFAWTQGLLAPYIDRLQLPIQPSPSTR